MNFSNTKKLRKILSLVTAIIMVTTLFTGCFGKKDVEDPTDPPISLPSVTDEPEIETQPAPTEPEEINENMATVLSQLNVRSSPTEQANLEGTLYPGDKVEVMQTQTNLGIEWGYITSPMTGWVCMDFVEMDYKPNDSAETDKPSETPDENQPDDEVDPIDKLDKDNPGSNSGNGNTTVLYKGTVTASELNIRSGASTNSDSVGSLKRGTKVEILEKSGNWGRIKQGWISLQHVDLENGGSSNSGSSNTKPSTGNGSTKVVARGIVNTKELNIRESPDVKSERLGSYSFGTRVEILEKDSGWGRTNKGWIALNYVYIDGSGTGNNKFGRVIGDQLNIRSGPGTQYDSVGSLTAGDNVTILYRVTVDDMTWGNIKQGWIAMKYVEMEDDDEDDDDDKDVDSGNAGNADSDSDDVKYRGIVTANGLNIRKAPDTDSDKVGSLGYGARVAILEEDGDWGRTSKGWINMDYVYVDGTGDGGDYGTVNTGLNIRSGPGQDYARVGSLSEGDEVRILFDIEVDGTTWGNIRQGWIALKYVDID